MSEQITKFPTSPVVDRPVSLYKQVVYPQLMQGGRPRIYTPGPITSGWWFNMSRDMGEVIGRNTDFALQFVNKHLLDHRRPVVLQLPNRRVPLDQTHITVPHALGKCIHPENGTKPKNWGEFDYYIVWLMTMAGLDPSLAPSFAEALAKDIDTSVVSDRQGTRESRVNEVKKVHDNAVRFIRGHKNRTKPVLSVLALPEPALDHHEQSVGTELEAHFAQSLNLPLFQLQLNVHKLREVLHEYDDVWNGQVAQWLLRELADQPANHSEEVVFASQYRALNPW